MEPGQERFAEKEEIFSFYLTQAELAFIDQPQDAALLMQYGAELGKAIAEGVMGAY